MDVFEKIKEKFANIHRVVTCDEDLEWNRAVYKCETLVNQVEQEHNNGWIPCSERLPEVEEDGLSKELLVIDKEKSIWTGEYYKNTDKWLDTVNGIRIDAIAWQYLPQPYKERDTNGN